MLRFHGFGILAGCIALLSAGCCGVPGTSTVGGCGSGCGSLANLASCKGGCGEVYVDEWISEPPVADPCGTDCGGCGRCGHCQPIRSALRLLWGRPFTTQCCPNPGGGGCDGGGPLYVGDTGQAMNAWRGCNCGGHHSAMSPSTPQPIPLDAVGESIEYLDSAVPLNTSPGVPQPPAASSANPTPAPNLPNSAKRLNPARRSVSTASSERQSAR